VQRTDPPWRLPADVDEFFAEAQRVFPGSYELHAPDREGAPLEA